MAIRMTGINSGLDTDSIIEALVSAQKAKVTKVQNKLTKSEWTEDIWKDLNTKLYSLYTKQLTKFKTQGSYLTKKVSSSDESVATATATSSAANGSHTLKVNKLAAAQCVTGAAIGATSNKTTLTSLGMEEGTVIKIAGADGKSKELEVTSDTTIADFTDACKSIGLNANFDTKQKRLFISSASSGKDSAFSIKVANGDVTGTKSAVDSLVDSVGQKAIDKSLEVLKNANISDLQSLATSSGSVSDADLTAAYNLLSGAMGGTVLQVRLSAYVDAVNNAGDQDAAWSALETDANANAAITSSTITDLEAESDAAWDTLKNASADDLKALASGAGTTVSSDLQEAYNKLCTYIDIDELSDKITAYADAKEYASTHPDADNQLKKLGLSSFDTNKASGTYDGMSLVAAQNAEIVLDGATLQDSSNSFSVNGLTIELKNTTELGKKITLNTTSDTSAVYDMVKDFVKTYNEILEELNTKYSAKSARDYAPLTDEQKEAMSDDEIEKWETKIKDSLLRRDNTLSSIINAMRSSLLTTTKVDGVAFSLSSFGIVTSSDYTEKGKLHIMGDEDDDTYATDTNKLKEALESNPEAVMKTLSEAGQSLYDALTKKMAKTSLSSALTFYNDKKLDDDQKSYKSEISKLEEKLTDLEDKYYKQFSAMEVAMSKLNSQSSYLASLMGGSSS